MSASPARRERLAQVVDGLGAVSPQSHPQRFPGDEHRLAYWLNAYNVFTLHAIIAEYPISSVWKTRDGQFFQRRRHRAGGAALSAQRGPGRLGALGVLKNGTEGANPSGAFSARSSHSLDGRQDPVP